MNKRQYKKLLAKRASQPKPSLTAPLLVASYSKDKLLAIASERNVTVRKSWNKTKIAKAIVTNQLQDSFYHQHHSFYHRQYKKLLASQ